MYIYILYTNLLLLLSLLPPSLPLLFCLLNSLLLQEIHQLRQEIEAQSEIIAIMGDALKENERRHESCLAVEKQPYMNLNTTILLT